MFFYFLYLCSGWQRNAFLLSVLVFRVATKCLFTFCTCVPGGNEMSFYFLYLCSGWQRNAFLLSVLVFRVATKCLFTFCTCVPGGNEMSFYFLYLCSGWQRNVLMGLCSRNLLNVCRSYMVFYAPFATRLKD